MDENKNKSKSNGNGLNKIIYILGTSSLAFMLIFSAGNFLRDARVLELPVLSRAAAPVSDSKTSETGDYKTLKYKKPAEQSTAETEKSPAPQKSTAPATETTPKAIPSSEP